MPGLRLRVPAKNRYEYIGDRWGQFKGPITGICKGFRVLDLFKVQDLRCLKGLRVRVQGLRDKDLRLALLGSLKGLGFGMISGSWRMAGLGPLPRLLERILAFFEGYLLCGSLSCIRAPLKLGVQFW